MRRDGAYVRRRDQAMSEEIEMYLIVISKKSMGDQEIFYCEDGDGKEHEVFIDHDERILITKQGAGA